MHYLLQAVDGPDGAAIRAAQVEAHKAFVAGAHVAAASVRVLISGPVLGADEVSVVGSFFLIEAESRAAVEAFHAADPFCRAGLWTDVRIEPFLKRTDTR